MSKTRLAQIKSMSASNEVCGYEILTELGTGAGSTVYRVKDPSSGKVYALKHVKRESEADDRFVAQLDVEDRISKAVDHPCLRKCHGLTRKKAFFKVTEAALLMEYLEADHLGKRQVKKLTGLVKVYFKVAEVLKAMNDAGYVHADIKPQNIMVTTDGQIRVIDLGQACQIGTAKERVQGTPDYIAPEQVQRRALSAQTDMYNFAATMYWSLTNRNIPTALPKKDDRGKTIRQEPGKPARYFVPEIPEALDRMLIRCLRTHPSKRPENWDMIFDALRTSFKMLTKLEKSNSDNVVNSIGKTKSALCAA